MNNAYVSGFHILCEAEIVWLEAKAAIKVGIFGIILIGLCSMSLGLMSQLISLDPIVYVSYMAGVMTPMVMVLMGALALWASESSGLFEERRRAGRPEAMATSLIAGLTTTAGAAFLFLLALSIPLEGIFPVGKPWIYLEGSDAYSYMGVAVLLAAYVALAVIGGALYGIVAAKGAARD